MLRASAGLRWPSTTYASPQRFEANPRADPPPPGPIPSHSPAGVELPSQLTLREKGFFRRTWLDVRANGKRLGKIRERTGLFHSKFDLITPGGRLVRATTLDRLRDGFKIEGADGRALGTVRERSPLGFSFELLDGRGRRMALIKERGLVSKRYDFFRASDKQKVASLERSTFRAAQWKASTADPDTVKPVVLALLAAYLSRREEDLEMEELEGDGTAV